MNKLIERAFNIAKSYAMHEVLGKGCDYTEITLVITPGRIEVILDGTEVECEKEGG